MLKWSSTPTLTLIRCHSLFLKSWRSIAILAQNRAHPPNADIALHGAGFIVRLPHLQRNLFRGRNSPPPPPEHGPARPMPAKPPGLHTWLKLLFSVSA